MRIVGHMLVRNEADVIIETLTEIVHWGLHEIVILDGESNDGTIELIEAFDQADIDLTVCPDPNNRFANYRRQMLLDLTRRHDPDWIISIDADEIYHDNPVLAIQRAEAAGANVVWQDIPNFWITMADIHAGLLVEDESQSVQARRRWYSWGHTGCFIWKDHPSHYYPKDESISKRTPLFQDVPNYRDWQVPGPIRTICKHYPFRSLQQALKRTEERQQRGGRRNFGKYFYDWIIDEVAAKLHYYKPAFPHSWNHKRNHETVYEYMGRLSR